MKKYSKEIESGFLVAVVKLFLSAFIFLKRVFRNLKRPVKVHFKTPNIKNVNINIGSLKNKLNYRIPKQSNIFLPRFRHPSESFTRIVFIPHLNIKLRFFILGIMAALFILFIGQGFLFIKSLPNPALIGTLNYPVSTQIFDRSGKLIYEVYRDQNRTPILLKDIPDYIVKSTIAIEDKDFYRHSGVSFFSGIIRAIKETIFSKKLQGGSTLTQQLVKSSLLTPERTISRKIREVVLALWAERVYSKDKILEMYLNQIPYGGASYGIEEAAKTYFAKGAKELTLDEAAFIAGLPQAPSLYSPYTNPQAAVQRRNEVLSHMLELKYISKEQYQKAVKTPLKVVLPNHILKAPHFVFYVKDYLENLYGAHQVEERGFRVTTTLDLNLQEKAESILSEELELIKGLNVGNGAVLITRPQTGEIMAMVGSSDYYASPSGAFNVTTAERQPGSSIKPLLYSLALERGFTAATIIDDSPVVYNITGSETYRPINYDSRFHGRVPVRIALANSYNVPAVKVLNAVGVGNFINHATRMGITTWTDPQRYGLSLALGGGEVKMVDMAAGFGVFANRGQRVNLNPILKIEDFRGSTIYEARKPDGKRVISEENAFIISSILSDNVARRSAFGFGSSLEIPGYSVAVKTGTTNEKKDNWTIGYTPDYLTAVWVGNNDNTPMNPHLTSGITGAAPIWHRIMKSVLDADLQTKKDHKPATFSEPVNIIKKICYYGQTEYFIRGTENKFNCKINYQVTPTPKP